MKSNQSAMIATLVKEGRLAKGYTQKELSDLSNISIRSIQRIENGEIIPRSYTIKTIAEIIGVPFEAFTKAAPKSSISLNENNDIELQQPPLINKPQRIIVSVGVCFTILFLAFAYIFQSAAFPETTFELLVYCAMVLLLITVLLFFIWRHKK
jgi:transcriptional regulator with XRE-family HTH domain